MTVLLQEEHVVKVNKGKISLHQGSQKKWMPRHWTIYASLFLLAMDSFKPALSMLLGKYIHARVQCYTKYCLIEPCHLIFRCDAPPTFNRKQQFGDVKHTCTAAPDPVALCSPSLWTKIYCLFQIWQNIGEKLWSRNIYTWKIRRNYESCYDQNGGCRRVGGDRCV